METVEINGKLYQKVRETSDRDCAGCALDRLNINECFSAPACTGYIFIEVKSEEEETK